MYHQQCTITSRWLWVWLQVDTGKFYGQQKTKKAVYTPSTLRLKEVWPWSQDNLASQSRTVYLHTTSKTDQCTYLLPATSSDSKLDTCTCMYMYGPVLDTLCRYMQHCGKAWLKYSGFMTKPSSTTLCELYSALLKVVLNVTQWLESQQEVNT